MTEVSSDRPSSGPRSWPHRGRRLLGRLERGRPIGLILLVILIGVMLYSALSPEPDQITMDEVEGFVADANASAMQAPAPSAQVYQAILPSLVVIRTESDDIEQEEGRGIGSGVIINSDAAILTSLHVVADARRIEVGFADGTRSPATISSAQPENDIAVLTPATLPDVFAPATIGSSRGMRVGDEVYAVGNPLGLAGSLSAGVISGFDRVFTPADGGQKLEGVIQFDAAVNPGNSGGPLLNRGGHVVGIVTGIVNPTDQEFFIGIGFAVPIDAAAQAAGRPAQ